MTPERWQIIKDLLADARERPVAARRRWLEEVCNGDPELLGEVESFLAQEDRLEGFIEDPILPLSAEDPSAEGEDDEGGSDAKPGRRIGPYRLVRLLAEGGMGAVYLAEREEDFEQRVALKLVRPGLTRRELIRRFHDERQILARLEHPNIARLLDGGTTEDGAPYFAMELIQGVPIDRYCDQRELPLRQRVELFLAVCSALAVAHQSLVVHRDLKPSNILVDATGTPKLLDFGIALLLDAGDGEADGATSEPAGPRVMTPDYASPEQLRGEAITTASDVYSLALVLSKVLTGHLPTRSDPDGTVEELRAMHDDKTSPSSARAPTTQRFPAAVRTREKEVSEPAGRGRGRRREAEAPSRRLGGDLDAILSKALRPDPRERYPSVEQLGADLRRYLDGLPVLAREGTFLYLAGKFVQRHRFGVANAALVLLLAVGFTVALVRQLHETERSRDQAQSVSSFVIDLFQTAAPDRPAGEDPTVRDLVDLGRARLEGAFEDDPEVRATLSLKLGEVYSKLGDYDQARELLVESVELLRRQHAGAHPDLATALADLAAVHFHAGDLESAEALFRESLGMRRELGRSEDLIKPMNNLATILMERGEAGEAEAIYRETLALRRAAVAAAPDDVGARRNLAINLRSLATALQEQGDLDAAEPLLRESLALRQEIYGPDSPLVATVVLSLGRLEHARGHLAEAEELIARGLTTRVETLGDDHVHTALARRDLAALRLERGDAKGARELLERALETLSRVRGDDDPDTAEVESLLGAALAAEGRNEEAEGYLRRGHEVLEHRRGPEAAQTRAARRRLADFLRATGRTGEAETFTAQPTGAAASHRPTAPP
jgi:serine/threonine protein kinase/Tfp pilus assembly protein PilF